MAEDGGTFYCPNQLKLRIWRSPHQPYGQVFHTAVHNHFRHQPAPEHGGTFYGPNQLNLWNTAERAPTNPTAHNDKDSARLYNETRRILEERTGDPVPAAS